MNVHIPAGRPEDATFSPWLSLAIPLSTRRLRMIGPVLNFDHCVPTSLPARIWTAARPAT
jgi:hypothetical protein